MLTNLVPAAQGKPRIKSYHFNIKTKGEQNDTDDNKNTNRATREAQRVSKEKRINS